jgi:uncharacterized protein with NAD-binding domain and iron-sulfur cluster
MRSSLYGAQVFRESFLKSAAAGRMGVPRVPLTDLYSEAIRYIQARGGEVRLRAAVESVQPLADKVIVRVADAAHEFNKAVLAVPYNGISKLLPASDPVGVALAEKAAHFESSPITGIHLWFDRQITDLDHAVLLDRTIQWMFHKSRLLSSRNVGARLASPAESNGYAGSYVELVVSASKSLVEKQRQEIIDLAVKELAEFFPLVREAKLLKAAVIKEVHATYSAQPLSDQYRPATTTGWANVFLAGDWTATGWPATMEGAVRSGYRAAEAIAQKRVLVADLPAAGLMRLFG